MGRYVLSESAQADIAQIIAYIRQRNPGAAKAVKGKFRLAMRLLADFPGLGHRREVYSYLIAYRAGTRPLEVARVFHGARGLGALAEKP